MLRDRFFPRGKLARQKINESLVPCETEQCQPDVSPQTAVPMADWAAQQRADAGLALKGLMETHQQRDWGMLELRWPQVSQVLRSPPTPADPARSLGTYPGGAGGGGWNTHLAIESSPIEQPLPPANLDFAVCSQGTSLAQSSGS